jgi:hypothetical protein
VKRLQQIREWLFVAALLFGFPASAQVAVGEDLKLGLSGELSTGYSGNYGDPQSSSHAMDFGGSGMLHGFFYNPQFLSFDVQPYYNRSQANSAFQSITNSSGFIASTNIFGGSHTPGSVSYSKTFDSTGQFGLPGVTGLETKGSSDSLVMNWSALFPNLPSLNVSYMLSGSDASLFGTDSTVHSSSRSVNLHSNYLVSGFQLNSFFIRQSNERTVPQFLVGDLVQESSEGESHNTSMGMMASHRIPLRGYWSANVTHSSVGSETQSNGSEGIGDGTSNSYASSISLQPARNLGVSLGGNYQDNVFGALQVQIAEVGAITPLQASNLSASSLNVRASADYQAFRSIRFNGQVNHTEEYIGGKSIGITQYGGGVSSTYARRFLGSLTFSAGAVDTATQEGNSGASLYGSLGFSRRFGRWETSADANYSQQVQTLGNVYTTSTYGYGGNTRRKFGDRLYWTNSARETHSGLAQHSGTSSHSESFLTNVLYHNVSVNAVYSQSGGTAILTSQGLIAIPGGIPTPLVAAPILYGARSYGGGMSASYKRFALTANYSRAFSQTVATSSSNNSTTMFNALLRCRWRKLYLNAGFTKFQQSVSAAGNQPSMLNSYFFGISRWFNVF